MSNEDNQTITHDDAMARIGAAIPRLERLAELAADEEATDAVTAGRRLESIARAAYDVVTLLRHGEQSVGVPPVFEMRVIPTSAQAQEDDG